MWKVCQPVLCSFLIITSKERTRMISFLYATTGFSSGQPWEGIWFAISCLIACIVGIACYSFNIVFADSILDYTSLLFVI